MTSSFDPDILIHYIIPFPYISLLLCLSTITCLEVMVLKLCSRHFENDESVGLENPCSLGYIKLTHITLTIQTKVVVCTVSHQMLSCKCLKYYFMIEKSDQYLSK